MRFFGPVFFNEVEEYWDKEDGYEAGSHHSTDDYVAHDLARKAARRLHV